MSDGSIQQTSYLKNPTPVVAPVLDQVLSKLKVEKSTTYSYEVSDNFLTVDADGDGLTNDLIGFGIFRKDFANFFKAKHEVQPFYFLIRQSNNGASAGEQSLQVFLSNIDGEFQAGDFKPSFGREADTDFVGYSYQALTGSTQNFQVNFVKGRFSTVNGAAVNQVDAAATYFTADKRSSQTTVQARIDLSTFKIIDTTQIEAAK